MPRGDGVTQDVAAHHVGEHEVTAVGHEEDRAGHARGAGDLDLAEELHQVDHHVQGDRGVRDTHREREAEEHRLLREEAAANLRGGAAQLGEDALKTSKILDLISEI